MQVQESLLLQPLTKYLTPHHHDPYFSSLDVLGSSASHFTLARLRASSQGQPPSCLWQALQKLFEEPGEKQGSTVPALCCSTMLGLPAASVAVLGNAKRDLLLSAFIRDNTNQVRPVATWLHLPNAKFQGAIFIHWLLFFRLKIAGKCDVNTEQTQGLSGSAGLLILVQCWVEIVT